MPLETTARRLCFQLHTARYKKLGLVPRRKRKQKKPLLPPVLQKTALQLLEKNSGLTQSRVHKGCWKWREKIVCPRENNGQKRGAALLCFQATGNDVQEVVSPRKKSRFVADFTSRSDLKRFYTLLYTMITLFVCIIYLYDILLILQQTCAGYLAQLSQENLYHDPSSILNCLSSPTETDCAKYGPPF